MNTSTCTSVKPSLTSRLATATVRATPVARATGCASSSWQATAEVLDEVGDADRVSVRAIARRAGVSPTALYLQFPDRDALVAAAVDAGFDAFNAALLAAAGASTEPADRAPEGDGPRLPRVLRAAPGALRDLFSARRTAVDKDPETSTATRRSTASSRSCGSAPALDDDARVRARDPDLVEPARLRDAALRPPAPRLARARGLPAPPARGLRAGLNTFGTQLSQTRLVPLRRPRAIVRGVVASRAKLFGLSPTKLTFDCRGWPPSSGAWSTPPICGPAACRRDAIATRVANGRLFRLYRGVYGVIPNLTVEGVFLAAVLACGPGAVLSHFSAAVLHGWFEWDGRYPEVTVCNPRKRPGIRTHRSQHVECVMVRGIPVTPPVRTVIDLSARMPVRRCAASDGGRAEPRPVPGERLRHGPPPRRGEAAPHPGHGRADAQRIRGRRQRDHPAGGPSGTGGQPAAGTLHPRLPLARPEGDPRGR